MYTSLVYIPSDLTIVPVGILAQVDLRIYFSIFPPTHSQMHGIHGFGLYSFIVQFYRLF